MRPQRDFQPLTPSDTIVAIATPAGQGGVGIVRISGPATKAIANRILDKALPRPRFAAFRQFLDAGNQPIDEGLAIFFESPHSFTGEDVLELQGHGGPVVLDMLLQRCIELGARLAQPGEFSQRAFLNDKIDLAQAEAIADLIDSGSEQAARSALKSLRGEFSKKIDSLVERLIDLRMHIEAALDFPEEEIDFLADAAIHDKLASVKQALETVFRQARNGGLLREGLTLVIVGQPNAGKSSLMNRFVGRDAAIVTHIPGTTRDVLKEYVQIDGLPLHILDTAGLRDSDDVVEQEGIKRAWTEIERADLCLLLIDDTRGFDIEDKKILDKLPDSLPVLRVYNKIDETGHRAGKIGDDVYISARTGEGFSVLENELKNLVGYHDASEGVILARRRHIEALQKAFDAVLQAERELNESRAGELVAENLRLAQESLGTITGRFSADDLLGEIFSSFCIGK